MCKHGWYKSPAPNVPVSPICSIIFHTDVHMLPYSHCPWFLFFSLFTRWNIRQEPRHDIPNFGPGVSIGVQVRVKKKRKKQQRQTKPRVCTCYTSRCASSGPSKPSGARRWTCRNIADISAHQHIVWKGRPRMYINTTWSSFSFSPSYVVVRIIDIDLR